MPAQGAEPLRRRATGAVGSTWHRSQPARGAGGTCRQLDITDPGAVDALLHQLQPDAVIHAAYRKNGPDAEAITAAGSGHVARAAAAIGARLVRVLPGGARLSGRIVETEAYAGLDDLASPGRAKPTKRNAPMYGPPGRAYLLSLGATTVRPTLPPPMHTVAVNTLPHLPARELSWRLHFLMGALSYTLAGTDVLKLISELNPVATDNDELLLRRLGPFLVAGLQAPLADLSERSELSAKPKAGRRGRRQRRIVKDRQHLAFPFAMPGLQFLPHDLRSRRARFRWRQSTGRSLCRTR